MPYYKHKHYDDSSGVSGFKAKYTGTCMICKEAILLEQIVRVFSKGKLYHVSCI